MTDYEKQYQENCDVCGEPFSEFIEFFKHYNKSEAKVLDLGCGQGRDTLFIARQGHYVLGVDVSQTGISQMLEEAHQNNLKVEGIVANIADYELTSHYDVILLDRVLHMLKDDAERTAVLQKSSEAITTGGFILIADTPKASTSYFILLRFYARALESDKE